MLRGTLDAASHGSGAWQGLPRIPRRAGLASESAASSICTQRLRCLFCPDGRKSHFSIPQEFWYPAVSAGWKLSLRVFTCAWRMAQR